MSEDLLKLIRLFGLREAEWTLELPAKEFYTGSVVLVLGDASDFNLIMSRRSGWYYVDRWGNGYRSVWVNEAERAIFTYVEGDMDLTVDADASQFWERMSRAEEFYKRH